MTYVQYYDNDAISIILIFSLILDLDLIFKVLRIFQ